MVAVNNETFVYHTWNPISDLIDVYTSSPFLGFPARLRQSASFTLYFYHISLTTTSPYGKDKAQATKGKTSSVLICTCSISRKASTWSATATHSVAHVSENN